MAVVIGEVATLAIVAVARRLSVDAEAAGGAVEMAVVGRVRWGRAVFEVAAGGGAVSMLAVAAFGWTGSAAGELENELWRLRRKVGGLLSKGPHQSRD